MIRLILVFSILLISIGTSFSQDVLSSNYNVAEEIDSEEYEEEPTKFQIMRLGVSPSALLNSFPGVQLSFDFGLAERLNVPIEIGYIHNVFSSDQEMGFMRGKRLKVGLQYIILRDETLYFAIGANYLNRQTYSKEFFIFDIIDSPNRQGEKSYEINSLIGFEGTLTLGFQPNERFTVEFGIGLGQGERKYVGQSVNTDDDSFSFNLSEMESTYNDEKLRLNSTNAQKLDAGIISLNFNVSYALIYR